MDIESGNESLDCSSTSSTSMDSSENGLMMSASVGTRSREPTSTGIETGNYSNESNTKPNHQIHFLQCPMEEISFGRALYDRCSWLIGLLLFQSCSSYILADNVELLQSHPAIIFYLTMLVGAGGNAGIKLLYLLGY